MFFHLYHFVTLNCILNKNDTIHQGVSALVIFIFVRRDVKESPELVYLSTLTEFFIFSTLHYGVYRREKKFTALSE